MIVSGDYRAIEWQTALEWSGDKVGCAEWISGEDMHTNNQQKFNLPERRIAKIFLFRLIFGGNAWSYAYDPDYSWISDDPDYWQEMIDGFYGKYKGLHAKHVWAVQEVQRKGFLEIPTGRQYHFTPVKKRGELVWPRNQIINHPVQGWAAELVKLGRIILHRRIKKDFPDALLVSTVHDSLAVDTPEQHTQAIGQLLHDVIHVHTGRAFQQLYGHQLLLPVRGEVSFGPNQHDQEDWKPA